MEETKKKTYEERRKNAFKKGKKYLYGICPLCLKARPIKVKFRIDNNPEVVQVRYGVGGRGCGGFYKKEDECIRLSEVEAKYPNVYNNLKAEIEKLYKIFFKK